MIDLAQVAFEKWWINWAKTVAADVATVKDAQEDAFLAGAASQRAQDAAIALSGWPDDAIAKKIARAITRAAEETS